MQKQESYNTDFTSKSNANQSTPDSSFSLSPPPLQFKSEEKEEEEQLQLKKSSHLENDQPIDPNKGNGIQLKSSAENNKSIDQAFQLKANSTGLPDNLKAGIENLSGYSMDDVNVNYNSSKPSQLQALAYAQGTDIHIGPGQENHLPHEAWHVVQQKQGRVQATTQLKGQYNINDNPSLEREADIMGSKALQQSKADAISSASKNNAIPQPIIQGKFTLTKLLRNVDDVNILSATHMERLIYWNEQGSFDNEANSSPSWKQLSKAMSKKIPFETLENKNMKEFMTLRESFSVILPDHLGGGSLIFKKGTQHLVQQNNAGWISNNKLWQAPSGNRFMIHVILNWSNTPADGEPNPHVTIRTPETQKNIMLDNMLPQDDDRIEGDMEVTRNSLSQGTGTNRRNPGGAMERDQETFDLMYSDETIDWLNTEVVNKAQAALIE